MILVKSVGVARWTHNPTQQHNSSKEHFLPELNKTSKETSKVFLLSMTRCLQMMHKNENVLVSHNTWTQSPETYTNTIKTSEGARGAVWRKRRE